MDKEIDNSKSSADVSEVNLHGENEKHNEKERGENTEEKCIKKDATEGVNELSGTMPAVQALQETIECPSVPTKQPENATQTKILEIHNATMKNEDITNDCDSPLEQQTVNEISDVNYSLDESLEIIEKSHPDAEHGKSVVIQSVVHFAPPNQDDLDNKTVAAIECESREETARVLDKVPEADVVEIMDLTENDKVNDWNEVILVTEQTSNKKPTNTQSITEGIMLVKPNKVPSSSLALLAQYGSDTDNDGESSECDSEAASVIAVPTTANKNYRPQVVDIDSNTDTDSTISSSAAESGDEYLTEIAKVINKRIVDHDDDDDDVEDNGEEMTGNGPKQRTRRKPPHVRGELLLDELPPIQDLQISVPAEECIEFGRVHSIVDQLLLVSTLPNSILLDLDTVLFLEQGKRVLGEVFDVLGQVADPLYCVRFNTNQQIYEKGINIGDVVYVAPKTDHTHYVILSSLTKMRGSDASWENDIEPPPRYLDYSDDEEEREARQQLRKQRQRGNRETDGSDDDDNDEDDHDDNHGVDAKKRNRMQPRAERNAKLTRPRPERHINNNPVRHDNGTYDSHYHRRQQRLDLHNPAPHNYQPQHAGSWHSHYNQQYHQRPPHHAYRSPYSGQYPYQRPMYHTTPPRTRHFHPYIHRPPMSKMHEPFGPPSGHTMPHPSYSMPPPMVRTPHIMPPTHHSQPLTMHSMPPSPQMALPQQSLAMSPVHQMTALPFAMSSQEMSQPPTMHSMPPQQQVSQPPPMHSMPPEQQISQSPPIQSMPPQQQILQSPPIQSMPPQRMMQPSISYNTIATQLPPQPQPVSSTEKAEEPSPPGAD
ncbi:H/ACA ribonucleoprotein complex non-core subunit NAF1 isoform X2 [Eurosta solidaginis]|uniref:H/ACA ribonucleoprotein complex non-core subunit NAF1 isoform X2 n=1 Tax=Eurosta solidaginis TaxID=178769 RepID=UPI003530C5DD